MAIETDDCDIRDTKFWMEHGGNGDYYICLMGTQRVLQVGRTASFEPHVERLDVRFAMSGGNTNRYPRVRSAIVELYRALDEAGLNSQPGEDQFKEDRFVWQVKKDNVWEDTTKEEADQAYGIGQEVRHFYKRVKK